MVWYGIRYILFIIYRALLTNSYVCRHCKQHMKRSKIQNTLNISSLGTWQSFCYILRFRMKSGRMDGICSSPIMPTLSSILNSQVRRRKMSKTNVNQLIPQVGIFWLYRHEIIFAHKVLLADGVRYGDAITGIKDHAGLLGRIAGKKRTCTTANRITR